MTGSTFANIHGVPFESQFILGKYFFKCPLVNGWCC